MVVAKNKLVKQMVDEVCEFLKDKYQIVDCVTEITTIIDNNIGYIINIIDEGVIEMEIK